MDARKRSSTAGWWSGIGALFLLPWCAGFGGTRGQAMPSAVVEGPWVIPFETLVVGARACVERTPAGPWHGPSCSECADAPGCSGGLRPGAAMLGAWLLVHFRQIVRVEGYCCRDVCADPPSGEMSVHGTGRAIDLRIPLVAGDADNGKGDPIAAWLVEHAETVGVQLLIWDGRIWDAGERPGARSHLYRGRHAHKDHLHVELSVDGAECRSAWYHAARVVARR